jgi:hypothetical protein
MLAERLCHLRFRSASLKSSVIAPHGGRSKAPVRRTTNEKKPDCGNRPCGNRLGLLWWDRGRMGVVDSSVYAQGDLPPNESVYQQPNAGGGPRNVPIQQVSIPGGAVAARSFQFIGPDGRQRCTLTLGPITSRGATLVLLNERGESIYTIPPQLVVHPIAYPAGVPRSNPFRVAHITGWIHTQGGAALTLGYGVQHRWR